MSNSGNPSIPKITPSCRCKTLDQTFEFWFERLREQAINGFTEGSRDGEVVGEYLNAITVILDPTKNIMKSKVRGLSMKYAIGELLWYMSGNNRLREIQKYTNNWDRMSDDGETVNSNYGHKIFHYYGFNQWDYVYTMLKENPESRQAVIHIKPPSESPSKDVPCTISLQFLLRDNHLHMTVNMRSNDIWFGFPYDVFNFTCFQILMSMELGVEIGTYTHISASLHLYRRDLEAYDKKQVSAKPIKDLCNSCKQEFPDCHTGKFTPKFEHDSVISCPSYVGDALKRED